MIVATHQVSGMTGELGRINDELSTTRSALHDARAQVDDLTARNKSLENKVALLETESSQRGMSGDAATQALKKQIADMQAKHEAEMQEMQAKLKVCVVGARLLIAQLFQHRLRPQCSVCTCLAARLRTRATTRTRTRWTPSSKKSLASRWTKRKLLPKRRLLENERRMSSKFERKRYCFCFFFRHLDEGLLCSRLLSSLCLT